MIEFRTLGTIDLSEPGNGDGLDAVLSRSKRVALLAYLALARPAGFHRRDSLILHFWPDADFERARRSLNQSTYVLRQALGSDVVVSRGADELGLDFDLLWCDAVAFDRHLAAGDPESALELYRGDLLRGFFLSDCPDFERWLDNERGTYRRRALTAAREAAADFDSRGNVTEAAHWLRRAGTWAPYEESLLLDLLALLGRYGDRAGATREYDSFARRLSEDMGLEPSPETNDLIERIQANDLSARKSILLRMASPPSPESEASPVPSARRPRRWPMIAAGVAALLAVGSYDRWLGSDPSLPAGVQPDRLMVATFASEMSADAPTELGTVAALRVAEALAQSGLVEVIPPSESTRWRRILVSEGYREDDPAIVRATAERAGAGLLVTGSYAVLGDSVHFRVRLLDVATGTLLRSPREVSAARTSPREAVATLGDRVIGAVGTVVDPRFAPWSAAATLPSGMESYRAYSRGVDEWRERDWDAAAGTFLELANLDSEFTAALVWGGLARLGAWEQAEHLERDREQSLDSVLYALAPVRDRLPEWERSTLDYLLAARRFDNPAAHRALREVVAGGPGTDWVIMLAGLARTLDRPVETREVLSLLDPNSFQLETHRWLYWVHYLWAHHRLGEYARELELVRSLKASYPETNWVHGVEIRALAALGRETELRDRFEVYYQGRDPTRTGIGAELSVHGYPDLTERIAADALRKLDTVPQPERDDHWRYERALLLGDLAGLPQAIEQIDEIPRQSPRWMDARAARGYWAAEQGDSALALQIFRELEDIPQSGYRWHTQARIAATLGDKERAVNLLRRMTSPVRGVMHREALFPTLVGYESFEELELPRG